MEAASLRADCARCAALCCVAPAFDRSDDFAIDKPNGTPCPNLGDGNECRIYAQRAQTGFRGCVGYDCMGAGQRVVQDVFNGQSWRDQPALLPAMVLAFSAMCEVHRLIVLLNEAAKLPLDKAERKKLGQFMDSLAPTSPWTTETLKAFEEGDCSRRIQSFLRSLEHHVARKQ